MLYEEDPFPLDGGCGKQVYDAEWELVRRKACSIRTRSYRNHPALFSQTKSLRDYSLEVK